MSGGEGVVGWTLDPKINALVVKITDAAIMCLDADEEATWRFAAFERGIVGDIAKFRSDALEALQAELQEQARIIGMSGEREAAHLARIAQLEAELAGAREAALEEAARACEKAGGAGFATDFARVVRALAEPRT